MATNRLPKSINPLRLADQSAKLVGEVSLSGMRRIAPLVNPKFNVAKIDLQFNLNMDGYRTVVGSIESTVQLQCQRCMQEFNQRLRTDISSAFLTNESAVEALPEYLDPIVLEEDWIDLETLIEDELILAIPLVPKHDESECTIRSNEVAVEEEEPEEKVNPFAVLAQLKSSN